MNSKCITDLNVSTKTIKLLEENTKENLCNLGIGKDIRQNFKIMSHKKNYKLDFIKIKNSVLQKPPLRKRKLPVKMEA